MEIVKLSQKSSTEIISKAVKVLKAGGILVYPTETCYGVGVDATSQSAVDKLMKYKSRREGKPLSVAVANSEMASQYVEINELAHNLYENYLPGPITVVSKGLGKVANGVESEFGNLGIRIPDYQLILDIVAKFGKPITSTSANMSYKPRPYSIEKLLEDLPTKQQKLLDLVIDAGQLPPNEPSTVVDTTLNNLNVMREGTISFNRSIEDSKVILKANSLSTEQTEEFGALVMLKYIDASANGPLLFALSGEMGAGKTHFVKGVARGLKLTELISSPTYTIIDEYRYSLGHRDGYLVHMDTWRVDGVDELDRVGWDGYLKQGNVIAVEWADKFYDQIIKKVVEAGGRVINIRFEYDGESGRVISVFEKS